MARPDARCVLLVALLAGVLGCAHRVPQVRFQDAPVAWQVDDRRDVPVCPSERAYYADAYRFDQLLVRPFTDRMAMRGRTRAANVNALDEVPDSTWFTNRIGRHPLTPDDVRRGPNLGESPERHRPWTILRTKQGGASPGFLMEDARGIKYLLKFDPPGFPEMETAADVIVQRLLWAAGYHVPEDRIVSFVPEDLVVAPDAVVEDPAKNRERPMSRVDVDAVLVRLDRGADGRIRGIVSRFLPGVPLGGHPERGVRPDDPNDLVRHEDRRDLRGQRVFFSWLAHTDVKENNFLDMWHEDPGDPKRHWVEHYAVDFGKALGVMGATARDPLDGYAYNVDAPFTVGSLLSLGLWTRPWERAEGPGIRGVGRFEAAHFHPGRFKSRNRYYPFSRFDRHDALWGTKILMRFTPEHIRAAVEQGKLSEPRSVEYLVRVLVARQRLIGRHWLSRVNPLDGFAVRERPQTGLHICADDLLLRHRLAASWHRTRYEITAFDRDGRRLGAAAVRRGRPDGRVCVEGLPLGDGAGSYTMFRFVTERPGPRLRPVWVHVARDATGRVRPIGIWRE